MSKNDAAASPEPGKEAVTETKSMSAKTMAIILGVAAIVGVGLGIGGVVVTRKMSPPAIAAAPATVAADYTPAKSVSHEKAAKEPAVAAAVEPAPAEIKPEATAPDAGSAAAPAPSRSQPSDPTPIPVLTGAEIKERYNITRFVDIETDRLCYLAEPRASGMNGSLTCEPRPSHVDNRRKP